jgi:hypothetical protein
MTWALENKKTDAAKALKAENKSVEEAWSALNKKSE